MSKELTSFFAELSANPLLMEKFEANPGATLAERGLSETERQMVLTRDLRTISEGLFANSRVTTTNHKKPKPAKPAKKKKVKK